MKNSTAPIVLENSRFLKTIDLHVKAGAELTQANILYIYSPLERKFNTLLKRFFDIVFSSVIILCFLSWAIPLIALFIKLDSKGPVFFLQKRAKKNRQLFTCIKFRTMIENEEADTLAAYVNDHRITKIGEFLRRHHLDELLQLFNVWWGDMSLIGPRPYMISDNQKFESMIEQYSLRYKVKPGITGLAQVLGYVGPIADEESMKERIRHDMYYIYHWTAALDIKIVCRTFFKMMGIK
jgi:putative colanic acid biosysnthesis UDP-glucose lipid carrier transferase